MPLVLAITNNTHQSVSFCNFYSFTFSKSVTFDLLSLYPYDMSSSQSTQSDIQNSQDHVGIDHNRQTIILNPKKPSESQVAIELFEPALDGYRKCKPCGKLIKESAGTKSGLINHPKIKHMDV